jgi:predicted nucleic acid-binding protein
MIRGRNSGTAIEQRRRRMTTPKPAKLVLLVDTCVWLDLAKDHREQPTIAALEDLVKQGDVQLVVPQIVIDEFIRNKERVTEDARRSLQSYFRLVKDAVARFGDVGYRDATLKSLNEVDHKIASGDEAVIRSVKRIEKLLREGRKIRITNVIRQRVTNRALVGLAPYHRSKNSVGDAILIEIYAGLIAREVTSEQFGFVTHNTKDFSDSAGDRRNPHPDLMGLFSSPKSKYWIGLSDALRELAPELVEDHEFEATYTDQPRRLSEIFEAEHLLFRQVWYNRHWNLRHEVETGKTRVVPPDQLSRNPYCNDEMSETIWQAALAAARRTEREVGMQNLGPWSDFEWGMINGKLSALRWVLGDEWDMLDT